MYVNIHIADKHLEIERGNIVLFNRYIVCKCSIAAIIREKPKIDFPRSRSFVKSLDEAK